MLVKRALVAGHVCLDVFPDVKARQEPQLLMRPGQLNEIGPARFAAGGAVANTGLALRKLGVDTKLMGKVGKDPYGQVLLSLLHQQNCIDTDWMIAADHVATSYTLVLNFPKTDRIFLHCPGANHAFSAADIPIAELAGVDLFHFGYPPLMEKMYENNGKELVKLMKKVKARDVITSLDMALPDPNAYHESVDWRQMLAGTLPHVDIFSPSLEEILLMIKPNVYQRYTSCTEPMTSSVPLPVIRETADEIMRMGCRILMIKVGDQGIYLRTKNPADQTCEWSDRELWKPCYKVDVKGTTGSGDTTIAGFLYGVISGWRPEACMAAATAVGACCCEAEDAISAIPAWEAIDKRVKSGWSMLDLQRELPDWNWNERQSVWQGPADQSATRKRIK